MSPEGKVLVVDDEPDLCWLLEQLLMGMGCSTATAENGRDALCLAECTPLIFAFVDAKLPDLEGVQLVRRLHQIQPNLPVVLISGFFYEDNYRIQEWIREGLICGFISKPFQHQEISKVLLEELAT